MGDQFLNTLRLFINQNPLSKTDPLKEHISNGRYDLDVLYYRGVGIMAGTIGKHKVVISYNRFENPEVFAMVIDGKQVDGHVSIDVVDTFCKTGELLAGIRLIPTIEELVNLNIADEAHVHPSRHDGDTHIVIVYPNRKVDSTVISFYCSSYDIAGGVFESFTREGYMAELFELNTGLIQLFLKQFGS